MILSRSEGLKGTFVMKIVSLVIQFGDAFFLNKKMETCASYFH